MKRSIPMFLAALATSAFFVMPASSTLADRDVPKVVREAKKVEESKKSADFTAPDDGQVWLVDMTDGERPIHSITLNRGGRYGFDTRNDYVLVNGKEGERVKLDRDHTYAIFFVTEDARDATHSRRSEGRDRDDRSDRSSADRGRVPDTAEVVDQGKNEELSFVSKSDGMVYLYDASDNKLIESWRLQDGSRITVSPKSNAIAIDQKTVSRDIELNKRHNYRLLFDRKDRN